MYEIAKVTLENEMDLILAHRRSMKLAELAGLSLSQQTSFATAVSEVARNTIESEKKGYLVLCVEVDQRDRFIVACLQDEDAGSNASQGLQYAKRLVDKYNVSTKGAETSIELYNHITVPLKLDIQKLDEWRRLFRNEEPISPYEELKRKNEQLQDLSAKVQQSEAQYKTLTNALPMIIFSLDGEGRILYANQWLTRYTGQTQEQLNTTQWKTVVHEADYDSFLLLLKNNIARGAVTLKTQARLRNSAGMEYLWHQIALSPFTDESGGLQYWIGYIVDIHAQKVLEETLRDNAALKEAEKQLKQNQQTLEQYIAELNRSNQELQQFAFVASHDLQEPVRKFLYYSDYLLNTTTDAITGKSMVYLKNMQTAAQRMRNLIQDLLLFSQINKEALRFNEVDLNSVTRDALQDLEMAIEEKRAVLNIQPLPMIHGDERMMRQLFENLISNSVKYSKQDLPPVIEITNRVTDGVLEIRFADNGIGFDQKYLPQMFTLFQRLHDRQSYEGTGLGLAICKKIIAIHNGSIRAEGEIDKGATFYVSLPLHQSAV